MKRYPLVLGLAVLLFSATSIFAQCYGNLTVVYRQCSCGGSADVFVCQGTLGGDCEQMVGPLVNCSGRCYAVNAGSCGGGGNTLMKAPVVTDHPQFASRANKGSVVCADAQVVFKGWLDQKLKEKSKRS